MHLKINRLVEWVKKHQRLLKLIFFGSVLFFVVNQMMNILHGMTWTELKNIMGEQSKWTLLEMLMVGMIGVFPLLLYDWTTVEVLERQGRPRMKRTELVKLAWIVNTINNLAGFGGIIGATLRANFYGKNIEKRKVVATVSKVAVFLLSGLSILSFSALVFSFFSKDEVTYQTYWIWLLGGSLFAPALLTFVYFKRKTLFKNFTVGTIGKLYLASIGQWSGALFVFLMVGYLLQVPVQLSYVFPLFIAATLIGMITMVPGGMGTFDVLMILGLAQMGISKELALVWLLYYRIFYYLIPFLTGILMFIHQAGAKVNQFFDGIPKKLSEKSAHFILVTMMYFAGIMTVLLSTVPNLSNISTLFSLLVPFSFQMFDQSLNLFVGFLLLGLARGVACKVKKAYVPSMGLLIFCILNMITKTTSWKLMIFYSVLVLILFLSRKEFYRKQMVYSWGAMIIDSFLFGFLVILYSIVGFYGTDTFAHRNQQTQFLFFPSDEMWLAGLVGLFIAAFTLLGLYQYLSSNDKIGVYYNDPRVQRFLEKVGNQENSYLLPLRDKRFYLYQLEGEDQVLFAFQRQNNKLFILGDPIGKEKYWVEATIQLMKQADLLDFRVVFYQTTPTFTMCLHELGFHFIKIGERSVVSLVQSRKVLAVDSAEMKLLKGEGYTFRLFKPPIQEEWLEQLENVDKEWRRSHAEKYFASARFRRAFITQSQIGAMFSPENQLVAYGLIYEDKRRKRMGCDLIRYNEEAPKNVVSALYSYFIEVGLSNQMEKLDLGFTPLAGVGENEYASFEERLAYLFDRYGNQLYEVDPYQKEKKSFAQWTEKRYLCYQKQNSSLLLFMQLILLLTRGKRRKSTIESLLMDERKEESK